MIQEYLRLANTVPYSRCVGFIEALRDGLPFDEAIAAGSFLPAERGLLESLRSNNGAVSIGRDLACLYTALGKDKGAEIVWTGPLVPSVGNVRATFPVARSLVSTAKENLIVAGYVTQVDVLERLGLYGALSRGVRSTIMMDRVDFNDPSIKTLLASGADVLDASPEPGGMVKFHAKAIVADRGKALVTSANLTHLGQTKNVELGLLVSGELAANIATLLERYAKSLRNAGIVSGGLPR